MLSKIRLKELALKVRGVYIFDTHPRPENSVKIGMAACRWGVVATVGSYFGVIWKTNSYREAVNIAYQYAVHKRWPKRRHS